MPLPVAKTKNIALWILQVLLALAFLGAGYAKLSGAPVMVQSFEAIGVGQWFRYVTGGLEVVAATLLLVPFLIPIGAFLLTATMLAAVATHLFLIGGDPTPAIVLLVLSSFVLWGRWNRISPLIAPFRKGN